MKYTKTRSEIVSDDGFLKRENVFVEVKLKRCPFCGGKANTQHSSTDEHQDMVFIECTKCEAASGEFLTHEEAASAWNKRV